MKIITKGSNYSGCGLGYVIDEDFKAELVSVFGSSAVTDEKVLALQKLKSRLDWGNESGIYGKLHFLVVPFMSANTPSTNAFYDLKSKTKVKVGRNIDITDENIGTYWAFDGYGCYPKYNADTSRTIYPTVIGYPMTGFKAWNSSEFCLMRRIQVTMDVAHFLTNGVGRDTVNGISNHVVACNRNNVLSSGNLVAKIPGTNDWNNYAVVHTGTGDFSTEKVVTNNGECFYESETGTTSHNLDLTFMRFGGDHSYHEDTCKEQLTFSVVGHAVGLVIEEARIVRDALMELKEALSL